MYLEHFGLTVNPFGMSPRLDFLYKSGAFEESMAHLVYGLDNNEAIILITGAIGTGKTMAIQSFLSYLGDRYVSAFITNTCVDGKELLKLVLDDLGAAADPRADKSDLLIAFKKLIIDAGKNGKRIIIIIDEAQNLTQGVLEEIRQLTNLGQGTEQPVQVVLVGQPELEATVRRPELAQLEQRIRVRYKLETLSRRELEEYIDHRLTIAGGTAGTFTKAAIDRIFECSGGVPRVVNAMCDKAMLSAFVDGRHKVEVRDIEETAPADELPVESPAPAVRVTAADPVPATRPAVEQRQPMATRKDAPVPPKRGHERSRATATEASSRRRGGGGRGLAIAVAVVAIAAALYVGAGRLRSVWPGQRKDARPVPEATRATDLTPENSQEVAAGGLTVDLAAAPLDTATVASVDSSASVAQTAEVHPSPEAVAATSSPAPASSDPLVDSAPSAPAGAQLATQVVAEVAAEVAVPAGHDANGEYYVHISSFRTEKPAQSVADGYIEDGVPALVHSQTVRDQLWFRVYLGPLTTRGEADALTKRLRDEGRITYSKTIRGGSGEGL